ncbi:MAG: SURF1 family protein [Aeromicrobium erythreum]
MSRHWFSPPLLALHLLAVVAVGVCVAGGLWQLGAYEGRQDEGRSAQRAAVPLDDVWQVGQAFPADLLHRDVTVQGRFAPADEQLWVEGDGTGGRAWLVAPFLVDGSDAALLVVRGSADRAEALPPVPSGSRTLEVSLSPSEGGGTPLDADRTTSAITIPSLLNELPHRLFSGYGISVDRTGLDLPLVPAPEPDVSWTVGLRNLAYAFQWWVFGLFALFMWWRMSSEQVETARLADAELARADASGAGR